ncbi:helix-turn-helix domain-containing protein [Streptomyces vilmorinianum]|uniref:helix-turn-helix domain-containing protein n=1 Tax=Streptomyces vilmorinianum TaxID=3051092 RepID=UPI0010FB7C16|nr:helix-turn-helix domain-containing protein [Streptomyces vilmorinianum]
MSFDSRFSAEERAAFAELVITGQQTTREIADKHEVSRSTVQSWVDRYRKERGVPTPPRGGGVDMSAKAVAKYEKLEKAKAESDRRAEVAESRLAQVEALAARQSSAIEALKGALRLFMNPDEFGDGALA